MSALVAAGLAFFLYFAMVIFAILFGYSLLVHVNADQGLWSIWIIMITLQLLFGGLGLSKVRN